METEKIINPRRILWRIGEETGHTAKYLGLGALAITGFAHLAHNSVSSLNFVERGLAKAFHYFQDPAAQTALTLHNNFGDCDFTKGYVLGGLLFAGGLAISQAYRAGITKAKIPQKMPNLEDDSQLSPGDRIITNIFRNGRD